MVGLPRICRRLLHGASLSTWLTGSAKLSALLLGLVGCPEGRMPAPPAIAGTRGFVQAGTGARVFDVQSGATLATLPVRPGDEAPAIDGDVLYAPLAEQMARVTEDGVLAFDVSDRHERWRTPLPGRVRLIRVTEAGVYVVTRESRSFTQQALFALDRETGAVRWSTAGRGVTSGTGAIWDVVPGGAEVVVWTSRELEALDAATGTPRWTRDAGEAPTVAQGSLYMVQVDGHFLYDSRDLHALDLTSGKEKWAIRLGVNFLPSGVFRAVPAGDSLVLFGPSFGLTMIDLPSRTERWRADCNGGGSVVDSIAVCSPRADRIGAWSVASGQRLWLTELPESRSAWTTSPVVGAKTVLVRTWERLYAVDLATGNLRYTNDLR